MIAFAFFLFALMIVSWLAMPGSERKPAREPLEHAALQTETQSA